MKVIIFIAVFFNLHTNRVECIYILQLYEVMFLKMYIIYMCTHMHMYIFVCKTGTWKEKVQLNCLNCWRLNNRFRRSGKRRNYLKKMRCLMDGNQQSECLTEPYSGALTEP